MGSLREHGGVGVPVIAAGGTPLITRRQVCSQLTRALQAPFAQHPRHDLTGATAQGYPQPERVGLVACKALKLIEHVARLAGQQRVHKGREAFRFSPTIS